MEKTIEFRQMIDQDINECETYLKTPKRDINLLNRLNGRYSKSSNNYPLVEMNPLLLKHHPDVIDSGINAIYGFLIAFRNNNYCDYWMEVGNPSVMVTQTNSNENQVSVNLTFEQVREKIEDMSSLKEEDIQDILKKIGEIEDIVNSSEKRTKKWDKAKDIIKWVADKGVDVGIALLPLLLKI